ncbi:LEAF RUST 10 DISEASE-RESISTANCE LOCUS RECEPTOR-LIKE PROTEIN KINASE-like 2.1 [Citrus sinensis]|uniref:LEAF RUST 10 DISEASE-RESISTANCE LOCUS RECEPTOR-LIKE PROTEIN KINASE-like 2.1 n=1 Tax=Citrus sinensis TaxID=2711 RepID=A0ACB8K3I4_CITSI|nr:LEAF RUST 10 DISEASE-RESISTANCE LOCUS RECEPTOR-LIKE PROTEIN KINASE-like 2.1 [Citrus sinensis]
MGLHLHLGPSMIGLFFFVINIIFVRVPTPVSADYEEHKNCSAPFRCANRDDIGYPFWGGNRPEYCGYPGFELNCEEDVPEINILNITYKVLKFDNAKRIITVAREDYWDQYCPSNLVDTALNFSLFDYVHATDNLTLYYSCPPNLMNGMSVLSLLDRYEFRCNSDESNAADNYFYSWDVNSVFNKTFTDAVKAYFGSCAKSVLLPLQQPTVESLVKNPASANLTRALQEGFGLQWFPNENLCEKCEQSKGECGYSARTGQFNCYCPDKAYPDSCPPQEGACNASVTFTVPKSVLPIVLGNCLVLEKVLQRKWEVSGWHAISAPNLVEGVKQFVTAKRNSLTSRAAQDHSLTRERRLPLVISTSDSLFSHQQQHFQQFFQGMIVQQIYHYYSVLFLNAGIGAGVVGIIVILVILLLVGLRHIRKKKTENDQNVFGFGRFRKKKTENENAEAAFIRNYVSLAPKRYNYSDVKRMTNSFSNKLGQGGFGSVYKGKLPDGRLVAVKVLKNSKVNGEEFINEVASMSRTSHVNVVSFLGFCYEKKKRALIYEFMPNGSLDQFIYDEESSNINRKLEWRTMCQIAVGIARGLEYLHRGCNIRIVHFDIKPHNILLGEDFCPKISDFGLAKLSEKKESFISMLGARGTIGYIAPEVFCRNFGGVSHKSDVYSYGMMILEMVVGRKNAEVKVSLSSEIYFPNSIYKHIEPGNEFQLAGVVTEEEKEMAKKMILVSLWCIQTNPSDRPSMHKVLEMLEGRTEDLQIPPKPSLSSPRRSAQQLSLASLLVD